MCSIQYYITTSLPAKPWKASHFGVKGSGNGKRAGEGEGGGLVLPGEEGAEVEAGWG